MESFLEHYRARFLEVLVKQRRLGYFLILWGAYLVFAVIQDPFVDYAPSSGYWGTALIVVNIILSLILAGMAVVLVFLGDKVLDDKTDAPAEQKLLGYFLVLWGAGWFLSAILTELPSHGYWTANLVYNLIAYPVLLITAVIIVLLGRKVLADKTENST